MCIKPAYQETNKFWDKVLNEKSLSKLVLNMVCMIEAHKHKASFHFTFLQLTSQKFYKEGSKELHVTEY